MDDKHATSQLVQVAVAQHFAADFNLAMLATAEAVVRALTAAPHH